MRFLQSPRWRTFLLVWIVFLVTVGGLLYRNWSFVEMYVNYENLRRQHLQNPDPLCRDLAAGRFKAGDSMEDLIATYPSGTVEHSGRFTWVIYPQHPNKRTMAAHIVAINGRLVHACIGDSWSLRGCVVFDTMNAADSTAYDNAQLAQYAESLQRRTAAMAVVGAAVEYQR